MQPSSTPTIVWLRRDLRLHDHAALHKALRQKQPIQPVFIFDTTILERFTRKDDPRLSFITDALCQIDNRLQQRGGGLLVLKGDPVTIMPTLFKALNASALCAAEDYEPHTQKRDEKVTHDIGSEHCHFVKDHVIFRPDEVLKDDGTPFKVYTPYSKAWRAKATLSDYGEYAIKDRNAYANIDIMRKAARDAGLEVLTPGSGHKAMLEAVGYDYNPLPEWPVGKAQERLTHFAQYQVRHYKNKRDMLAEDGTSQLSPYLRFGLVSVRECFRAMQGNDGSAKWLSELIWREFYMMILYYAPASHKQEWNEDYRSLPWKQDVRALEQWKAGKTGYPVVDAAMRQLTSIGWMHNRARMIVASFLTKDLHLDWRLGEEHFAQYLMDYEMSSNVGGWQWAASTGTDAQPYFRIFNPLLQSKKFDPDGDYIRTYIPELRDVEGNAIHEPRALDGTRPDAYPEKIVDHKEAREQSLTMFKKARGEAK